MKTLSKYIIKKRQKEIYNLFIRFLKSKKGKKDVFSLFCVNLYKRDNKLLFSTYVKNEILNGNSLYLIWFYTINPTLIPFETPNECNLWKDIDLKWRKYLKKESIPWFNFLKSGNSREYLDHLKRLGI